MSGHIYFFLDVSIDGDWKENIFISSGKARTNKKFYNIVTTKQIVQGTK
jgi:hypothetical protein